MLGRMAKDQNQRRRQKASRKKRRQQSNRTSITRFDEMPLNFGGPAFQPGGMFGGGFGPLDDLANDDFDMTPPPDALMDTTHCPVGDRCEGCGAKEGQHPAVAVSSGSAGKWDAACATVCSECDGKSFMNLLGIQGTQEAVSRHASHAA